jgi:hypothetical protein
VQKHKKWQTLCHQKVQKQIPNKKEGIRLEGNLDSSKIRLEQENSLPIRDEG